jgi:hypothetical protein
LALYPQLKTLRNNDDRVWPGHTLFANVRLRAPRRRPRTMAGCICVVSSPEAIVKSILRGSAEGRRILWNNLAHSVQRIYCISTTLRSLPGCDGGSQ